MLAVHLEGEPALLSSQMHHDVSQFGERDLRGVCAELEWERHGDAPFVDNHALGALDVRPRHHAHFSQSLWVNPRAQRILDQQ